MTDFKKMTVEDLRELARKMLGPGHSRKTKGELIAALEAASGKPASPAAETARVRTTPTHEPRAPARAAARARSAASKATRAAQKAGQAARNGARAIARASKAAVEGATQGAKEAAKTSRARQPSKGVSAAAAAVARAAAGAAAGISAARQAHKEKERSSSAEAPDPEGYFVARVRGEEAIREAPHAMGETTEDHWTAYEEGFGAPVYDEQLGELPWSYGDDAFVALPRDPQTVFLYWDHARDTVASGFEGLDDGRAQLWMFARGDAGWERVRVLDFALESRSYYVHELEPGRSYRAEIHIVDRSGRDRLLGASSNEVALPPVGPSPLVDDRFIRIPWDMPLGRLLGPGHVGGPFPEEARAMLARLSDWTRFSEPTWGGSAGGMGGRPFSPTSSPSWRPQGGSGR